MRAEIVPATVDRLIVDAMEPLPGNIDRIMDYLAARSSPPSA
jgi:hypothetical protein